MVGRTRGSLVGITLALALLGAAAQSPSQPATALTVDVDRYLKKDGYGQVRISPAGEYFAVTVNLSDRSVLWVQRRSDGKVTAKATGGPHSEVADFRWVNDRRLIIAWAKKEGSLETPQPTGELFGLNADGSGAKQLIGHFEAPVKADSVAVYSSQGLQYAQLIDTLPRDDKHVLVAVSSYEMNPMTRVVRMDVDDGSTTQVATAPLRRARFVADRDGVVRFAEAPDNGNFSHLLYRADAKSDWKTINDEHASGHAEWPLGFSADGRTAYLQVEKDSGPDAIVALDVASGQRRESLRDPVVDPEIVLRAGSDEVPVGASFMGDRRGTRFFDEDSDAATLQRSLEAAFPGQSVLVVSHTRDGQLVIASVGSDTDPGSFYLYNRQTKAADQIVVSRGWLDPKSMTPTRAVTLAARDGLALHGYLTLPKGEGTNLPMVVLPHGGPFGISDDADFDEESQMLAEAGYAVLRVNFRGSGNYGRAFEHAGAREWGGRMQDDLTDATRWAIAQKIADPQRVCLYGASYGAYAAMMGLAKEPGLYRCGIGYAGVYDLPMMLRDEAGRTDYLKRWFADWVGAPENLAAVSPVNLAARIKQPVFLAAGGKDETAPIEHTRKLEKALVAAGAKPQTLYFPTEGHGFYTDEHRHAFYVQLIDFLAANLGGEKAQP